MLVTQVPKHAQPLPLANSDKVKLGQRVVEVGNPLALGTSVSTGIVSALNRSVDNLPPMMQYDAPTNPGNSGGPVTNIKGEVIGVAEALFGMRNPFSTTLSNTGLAYATPSNVVRKMAREALQARL